MKRILATILLLAMMAVSLGGCWVVVEDGGRDGWGGRHGGDRGHERGHGHEERR